MSGLGCRTRLAFGTRRRNFAKASLGSFKVNPRLRLGLTLNSSRLALYERGLRHNARLSEAWEICPHAPPVCESGYVGSPD